MKCRAFRRYQKSLAMLLMTVLLAGMASAAGEKSVAPCPQLSIRSR